jgi:hypothetical protein
MLVDDLVWDFEDSPQNLFYSQTDRRDLVHVPFFVDYDVQFLLGRSLV